MLHVTKETKEDSDEEEEVMEFDPHYRKNNQDVEDPSLSY